MDQRIAKRVLLIGWDSADWKIITPLLDAGLMPTLEGMINRGVMGNIATLHPPISPILWNSIATGKHPQKHGIFGFVEPMPDGSGVRAVTSTSRKCKAIWNILTQAGLRTHVVGWFASHPAEPINGVCVSNRFYESPAAPGETWPVPPQSVHPEKLAATLAGLRVHPSEIIGDHLQPLVPRAAEIDQTRPVEQKRLNILRKYLAESASIQSMATGLMENEAWDFMAVYYNAMDMLSHYFMVMHPPRMNEVGEQEFEIYKDVINGVYRFHDMMLERLLQLAGPETTVILLSDHGFYSDHLRPRIGSDKSRDPAAWHRSHGIVCLQGPGIAQDERIYGTTLLDIVPTVLSLFGLPVADDMDGKPLLQAFQTPPRIDWIPSWENVAGECGMHPLDLQQDPVAAQEALQQLVDLGYIQAPTDDVKKTIQLTTNDLQFNRAVSLMNYGSSSEAISILKELSAQRPNDKSIGLALAQGCFTAGLLKEAEECLETLHAKHPNSAAIELMRGNLLLIQNKPKEALEQLLKAEQLGPTLPQLHVRLGNAYLRLRSWRKASDSFRKALEIDGDNAEACHGLSQALCRENRLEEAAEMSLRAVGLQHCFPSAHFQLGAILARLNQPQRAAMAFELGLTMSPNAAVAHRYLARLYYRLGEMKKCHEHQEAVSKLRAAVKVE